MLLSHRLHPLHFELLCAVAACNRPTQSVGYVHLGSSFVSNFQRVPLQPQSHFLKTGWSRFQQFLKMDSSGMWSVSTVTSSLPYKWKSNRSYAKKNGKTLLLYLGITGLMVCESTTCICRWLPIL